MVIASAEHRFPGPAREHAIAHDRSATSAGEVDAVVDHRSPQQHRGRGPVRSAHHVRAHMDPVAAVRVQPTRPAEHHAVAPVGATEGMRRGVGPGSVGRAAVGLDFDDCRGDFLCDKSGAEQPPSRSGRVDDERVGFHRTNCANPY